MKKLNILLWVASVFLIVTTSCFEKEDPNGHELITFINNSDQKIILLSRWNYGTSPDTFFICNPAGRWKIEKGDSIKSRSMYYSWEKDFKYIPFIQFFVLSEDYKITECQPENIKELTQKYQLKRYLLTQSDLEEMNWTITYP